MRVCVDATPLLGHRTGVGRYVESLVRELPAAGGVDLELTATAFTWRGLDDLGAALPPGVVPRGRRAPARVLQQLWSHVDWPPAELVSGNADVFHGTNFVLPPVRSAEGVVTIHDLSFLRAPHTVDAASLRYRQLVPRSVDRARVICTPSHSVAEEVTTEYRISPDRIVVTPLGVDPLWLRVDKPSIEWLAAHGMPETYLLFVGTLEPRKDLPTLLRAYRRLGSDLGTEVPPLVLVGPQGWGPALETAGIERGSVITPGYLDDDELRPIIAGASALVLPSLYEGFGLPPLEAMACGTPVIVSHLPVFAEVLGDHARLFPVGDADALAAAIIQTLADAGPTSSEARRAHAATWTWRACAEATLTAYLRAMAS